MNIYHENQVPWPSGRPYTEARKNGPFKTSIPNACERIEAAVAAFILAGKGPRTNELWIYVDSGEVGARNRFLANQRQVGCAVAVRFDLDGKVNFVETIGPGGRLILFADDEIDANLLTLKHLRREVWRLAIESEIADHRRNLEVPVEESTP